MYVCTYKYTLWIESMWEYQEGWSLVKEPNGMRQNSMALIMIENVAQVEWGATRKKSTQLLVPSVGNVAFWFRLKPGIQFHIQTAAVVIGLLLDRHRTTTTRSFWTRQHERTWRWIAMRRLPSLELAVASIEPLDTAPVEFLTPKSIGWTQKLNKTIQHIQPTWLWFQRLHCWSTCTCLPAHKTVCCTSLPALLVYFFVG